uniref:Protein kinase domain-containing protein n=1 Tax=Mycena chlorophos TaxID=658473 RepID=A0ABQ0M5V1_MYCCL|nr:predicted protein [Mycena chlorophos]
MSSRSPSPASSLETDDESDDESVNLRLSPCWHAYRAVLESRGFHLHTVSDVLSARPAECPADDTLCPDAGLPANLFRGARVSDGSPVVVKAVHRDSREFDIIHLLSSPPLSTDQTNHSIPVLDLIETDNDCVAFIVMEQWSSQLIDDDGPCCLREFLAALRQCLEHVCFMHKHRIAHLDISLRNLLTDYKGHYAFIDYEMSRRFDAGHSMRFQNFRSTEVPPECEHGECREPFKADVWALAVLILRACKLAGYCIPELLQFTRPMLDSNPQTRPSMPQVLAAFEKMASSISGLDRLPNRQ